METSANSPLIARVEAMEAAVGRGLWAEASAFFTEDARYQVADRPPYHGVEGIRTYMTWQRNLVDWTGHTPRMMIQHDRTVIIEVLSHFKRHADGQELRVPCTDIYRFDGDRIFDWRVYADVSLFLGDTFPFRHDG